MEKSERYIKWEKKKEEERIKDITQLMNKMEFDSLNQKKMMVTAAYLASKMY